MSGGDGCGGGMSHCGSTAMDGSSGIADAGYAVGPDGHSPIPNIKRVMVNGAPVTDASHEFVLQRPTDNGVRSGR